jgi:hypothetical protein
MKGKKYYNFNPKSLLNLRKPPKGVHYSPETEFKKGQPSPLRGKKNPKGSIAKTGKNNPMYGRKPNEKQMLGLKGAWGMFKGKKRPEISGDKSPKWKGGITPENQRIRGTIEIRLWRESVFSRDNWTCQKCKERGGRLHAHHIKNFSQNPELRTSIENGITFCKKCHINYHKKFGIKNNNKEQICIYLNQ